jgi:hypothetical protein
MITPHSTIHRADSDTLLITFGCSWTKGVGAAWQPDQDYTTFKNLAWDEDLCYQFGWRGQLCAKLGFDNLNFSAGASSNQKQFRLATEFFSSSYWKKLRNNYQQIKVLWGITSTARNEIYDYNANSLRNFMYTEKSDISKFFLTYTYDHKYEVETLHRNLRHWNHFFQNQKVDIYWFDTFNTHDYANHIPGMCDFDHDTYKEIAGQDWPEYQVFRSQISTIDKKILEELFDYAHIDVRTVDNLLDADDSSRDLMSMLCKNQGFEVKSDTYHVSDWEIDCDRVDFLVKQGLLNPYSHHPTRVAHTIISDYFVSKIH